MAHHQPYRLIGVYDCWSCHKEVPVKQTPQGRLVAVCLWCDFRHDAAKGTIHEKNLRAATREVNDAALTGA